MIVAKLVRVRKPAPITVRLPDLDTVPEKYRGKPWTISYGVVSSGDDNPKLLKSNGAGTIYRTWGISLAPSTASGYQVCAKASPACSKNCLHLQGHGRISPPIAASREAKTIALFEQRDWFEEMLRWQLSCIVKRAEQGGFTIAFRPNIFSDIMWEHLFPWMFTDFPQIQFYDYTKLDRRMMQWCSGFLPPNYHLTFSRSEVNHDDCLRVLLLGGNVAIVFRHKALPKTWQKYPVINGDLTDLRFLDDKNVIVGLYAKGTAKTETDGFVVNNRRVSIPMLK